MVHAIIMMSLLLAVVSNVNTVRSFHSSFILDTTLITTNPYNGQVRLIDGGIQSSGLLEIYLHKEWGTVCATEFNDAAADSACRQLGYTEALNFTQIARYVMSHSQHKKAVHY